MTAVTYNRIVSDIKELNIVDQLRLLKDMAGLIQQNTIYEHPRSLLELQGKGKHIWKGVDAQEYIDKERASWNG